MGSTLDETFSNVGENDVTVQSIALSPRQFKRFVKSVKQQIRQESQANVANQIIKKFFVKNQNRKEINMRADKITDVLYANIKELIENGEYGFKIFLQNVLINFIDAWRKSGLEPDYQREYGLTTEFDSWQSALAYVLISPASLKKFVSNK
jgi:hypothetical protein